MYFGFRMFKKKFSLLFIMIRTLIVQRVLPKTDRYCDK